MMRGGLRSGLLRFNKQQLATARVSCRQKQAGYGVIYKPSVLTGKVPDEVVISCTLKLQVRFHKS